MHKLRNTKHIKILNSLYGIVPPGCREPLSKKKLRYLLHINDWNSEIVRKLIETDEWWYHWAND